MFIGEWSEQNLHNIVKVLKCFHLALGLKINIAKSQVLGAGVSQNVVLQAANRIGCAVLNTPFHYLGVTVGECMSRKSAWVGLVNKLQARLSKWKVKTISIGVILTLLKSVLGASPIYYMSIFKVPKGVLKIMESIRTWDNVLASKPNGGLGVSCFFALNRAILLKLPTRVNLSRRGFMLNSHLCPLCNAALEDVQHVFFRCDVARVVLCKICHWWDLDWQEICSFSDWDA
nr:RNA-directed DNA polymerase, eukaryota [Tanacetum cinerariifolium]